MTVDQDPITSREVSAAPRHGDRPVIQSRAPADRSRRIIYPDPEDYFADGADPREAMIEQDNGSITLDIEKGNHTLDLTVTDSFGATGTASIMIEAVDDTPPLLEVSPNPAQIWPPNHKMVPVFVEVQATDGCGIALYRLLGVTSDEPETGCGSGDQAPDIQGVEVGRPDVEFEVRAERCGTGDGRTYTAVYEAVDPSGNSTTVSATITVPHDKR